MEDSNPLKKEWYSVATTPIVDGFYIVSNELGDVAMALYKFNEWHTQFDDFEVTHWIFVPKPPNSSTWQ